MAWLRPRSKKREAEAAERRRVVAEVGARDRWTCQAKNVVPEVPCIGPLDVHEIIPRSAWRAGYLVVDNCLIVCRSHHDWIGDNPDEAHARGLHGYSWEVPEENRRWR
jgi:hypothetical protein